MANKTASETRNFLRGVLKISWNKIIIWSVFLLLTYILRHFFFIIFMTFLIAYLMGNLITFLCEKVFKTRSHTTKKILTVVCFVALLFSSYSLGRFFLPKLVQQGQSLIRKIGSIEDSPQRGIDAALRVTVGQWLFEQQVGGPGDPEYDREFQAFQDKGLLPKEYVDFEHFAQKLEQSAEREFNKKNAKLDLLNPDEVRIPLKRLRDTNLEGYFRIIKEYYAREFPLPQKSPYEWDTFEELSRAYQQGPERFSDRYKSLILSKLSPPDQLAMYQANFAFIESRNLVQVWKDGPMAEKLGGEVEKKVITLFGKAGDYVASLVPALLTLPVQLILSLMLSFFITFDIDRLSAGANRLRHSRVGHIYVEIIPGLNTFASLIGRAFQAQGCIAIVNSIMTYAVISFLGIENGLFLASLVFLCSFIPVLGVVISGAPIAIMALIQDGGSIAIAAWAILGILAVHFIETSILNPKIVGTFLHLHPVLVLVILALGEHFFGVWGLLLGLPVAVYIIRIIILDEGLPWEKK